MKRRNFLKHTAAGLAMPHFIPGYGSKLLSASSWVRLLANSNNEHGRVLVLVRLDGGNDGLNTVIPLDQYDKLANARPQVVIPEQNVLALDGYDTVGLHPVMWGIRDLFNEGKIKVVQSVGYPNQDFSHFRSSDIWMTGADADEVLSSGWAGRYLHYEYPNFPADYPNADMPDPLSLQVGGNLSLAFQGPLTSMGMSVHNPEQFYQLVGGYDGPVPDTPAGDLLAHVRTIMRQTNLYGDVVTQAYEQGANLGNYPDGNRLAEQLKIVARLISGGLKTPIYMVTMGGFDTHDNQVVGDNPAKGEHAVLLGLMSEAISAFVRDIELLGHAERVLGMTFSEFGRRIKSNDSFGTDHGAAAPMFVFGQPVEGGVLGDTPDIPANAGWNDNVAMQFDFRSVYGTLLKDWFCVPEEDLQSILFQDFQLLPILNNPDCLPTSIHDRNQLAGRQLLQAWPNPFAERTRIRFTGQGRALVQVFNGAGQLVATPANRDFPEGEHLLDWDSGNLPAGNYYIRLQMGAFQQVEMVVKIG
ncbi:MAG: DUF1501 domain-containing protein [Lewinellaceae bacterium]|nr:DUF1501 domain-containing protein [Lewinellaceae bacterium]